MKRGAMRYKIDAPSLADALVEFAKLYAKNVELEPSLAGMQITSVGYKCRATIKTLTDAQCDRHAAIIARKKARKAEAAAKKKAKAGA